MYILKGDYVTIELPQCWAEVKYCQFVELGKCGKSEEKVIELFTNMPPEDQKHFDVETLHLIRSCLYFLREVFDVNNWIVPDVLKLGDIEVVPKLDIKERSWGQRILSASLLGDNTNVTNKLITFCEIYLQPEITKKDYDIKRAEEFEALILNNILLCDVYAIGNYYEEQVKAVLENEAKTLSVRPTKEQELAGISMYNYEHGESVSRWRHTKKRRGIKKRVQHCIFVATNVKNGRHL